MAARNLRQTLGFYSNVESFIDNMITDEKITSDDLFITMADIADSKGYELRAEQQGIRGTYLHFVKKPGGEI